MSIRKQTLFQAVLARISFGAVPVDGSYWFDPKDAGAVAQRQPRTHKDTAPYPDWSPIALSWTRAVRRPRGFKPAE